MSADSIVVKTALALLKECPCELANLQEFLLTKIPFQSRGKILLTEEQSVELAKELMYHPKTTIFKGIEMDDWIGHVDSTIVYALRHRDNLSRERAGVTA